MSHPAFQAVFKAHHVNLNTFILYFYVLGKLITQTGVNCLCVVLILSMLKFSIYHSALRPIVVEIEQFLLYDVRHLSVTSRQGTLRDLQHRPMLPSINKDDG